MVYVVPESQASKPENRFEFQIGKKTYSIPKMEFVSGKTLRIYSRISGMDPESNSDAMAAAELLYDIFSSADAKAGEAVQSLEPAQVLELFSAWSEAGELEPGESDGSGTNSEPTEKL